MLKVAQIFLFSSLLSLLSACQTNSDTNTLVGSPEWQKWVESVVQTGDGAGHGPDIGSAEWCGSIERLLFAGYSNLQPCSDEWNRKVDDAISH